MVFSLAKKVLVWREMVNVGYWVVSGQAGNDPIPAIGLM